MWRLETFTKKQANNHATYMGHSRGHHSHSDIGASHMLDYLVAPDDMVFFSNSSPPSSSTAVLAVKVSKSIWAFLIATKNWFFERNKECLDGFGGRNCEFCSERMKTVYRMAWFSAIPTFTPLHLAQQSWQSMSPNPSGHSLL
jgi:hypothetical protein